jgi:uroporphyrinogen III methyltransferase/synthase
MNMEHGSKEGIVYLVGAGPGDPDLITVRARYLLDNCDAVVYDSLIPDELLVTLPVEVDLRYVGKKTGEHSLPQQDINNLLVRLASQGKRVVRLKGGDPFVFGRGAEEGAYLREHGIPFEIVPGITSGVAAPAFSGIPCTDRTDASYVMFLTGHKAVDKVLSSVPWEWVGGAKDGTLVIYMGVAEIPGIVEKLLAAGMPPDLPAAAIERGTVSTQRTVTSTLSELPDAVAEAGIRPPALFVIGKVVKHHETLKWFENKPLFGARVMVTRPADQSAELYRELRELGAEVLAYPTIATIEDFRSDDWDALRKVTAKDRWVVLTSENGVRYFLKQWYATIGDIRALRDYKIAAIGDGTARALNASNIAPDFARTTGTIVGFADQMIAKLDLFNATIVRVRSNLSSERVEKTLEGSGATVIPLQVYRSFPAKWSAATKTKLFANLPDVVIFTSGAAAAGLAKNLTPEQLAELTGGATVVSIGPATTKRIESYGINVGMESKVYTMASIVEDLIARHHTKRLKRRS